MEGWRVLTPAVTHFQVSFILEAVFFFPRETSILPQYQVIFLFFNWNVYKLLVINTKCKLKRNVFCVYYCRSKGNSTAQIIFNTETQNISANTYSFQ